MRNIAGYPFPHKAARLHLEEIRKRAIEAGRPLLDPVFHVPEAERAVLVGSRLIAPDFDPNAPGRCVLLSGDRTVAVMVNEEDHLRIQAVTAGWSLGSAQPAAEAAEAYLSRKLPMARDAEFGWLAASLTNAGGGARLGVMLHLAGLAAEGCAEPLLRELDSQGVEIRGLHGESTAGTAGYVQVSVTKAPVMKLESAIGVLMDRERAARRALGSGRLVDGVAAALARLEDPAGLSLEGATRIVGWLRLGALHGVVSHHPRRLDALLTLVGVGDSDEPSANSRRARLCSRFLELTLDWPTA
jgi:protein arginine kinase